MATWEIQLYEHPSVTVELEDDRDLEQEWLAYVARRKRTTRDRWWRPAPGTALDSRIVRGVHRVRARRARHTTIRGFNASD